MQSLAERLREEGGALLIEAADEIERLTEWLKMIAAGVTVEIDGQPQPEQHETWLKQFAQEALDGDKVSDHWPES